MKRSNQVSLVLMAAAGIGAAAYALAPQVLFRPSIPRRLGLSPERRARFISSSLPDVLTFQRLPACNQPHPKFLVAGSSRRRRKATAFIGAPPKLVCTRHVTLLPKELFFCH